MAYTTINKSSDHFNTKLWTGTGSSHAITGVGFQPDFVWVKPRNLGNSNRLHSSILTAPDYYVMSENTDTEATNNNSITSFDSDGFTLGNNDNGWNDSSYNYVSWNWKGGTTSGLSGGDITPSGYSYNATSGFGVYKYAGNSTDNQTITHGLGATPNAVFFKSLTNTESWRYHTDANSQFFTHRLILNDTTANTGQTDGLKAASSTTITLGNGGAYNTSGQSYIMYLFVEKKGFSKFGKYTGNTNNDGPFIYTGFKPGFIMCKNLNTTDNWNIFDSKRAGYNFANYRLFANDYAVENTSSGRIDILSNGFKLRSNDSDVNSNTVIYLAFAEAPLVGSNNVPCTAR